jgi:hypothetical protein
MHEWPNSDNRESDDTAKFNDENGSKDEDSFDPQVVSYDVKDWTWGTPTWVDVVGTSVAASAILPYVQAIASELGKRTVDRASFWIHCRLRYRGNHVKSSEIDLRISDSVTTIELTGELSDKARQALFELDFNSSSYRDKLLRWDADQNCWTTHRNPRGKRAYKRSRRRR